MISCQVILLVASRRVLTEMSMKREVTRRTVTVTPLMRQVVHLKLRVRRRAMGSHAHWPIPTPKYALRHFRATIALKLNHPSRTW